MKRLPDRSLEPYNLDAEHKTQPPEGAWPFRPGADDL